MRYDLKDLLYENPLSSPDDVKEFRVEGPACLTFPRGRMRMENAVERDMDNGVHGNFLLWCPREFPDGVAVSWDFRPLTDVGLAMAWVAAKGRGGEDLFDRTLAPRDGAYGQYHHGDIDALHVSYFRRNPSEIGFQTCNVRKSYGFHLVARGADPLPSSRDARESYRVRLIKSGPYLQFAINDLTVIDWKDDGEGAGPVLSGGKIGFRQMAGLVAEYANLQVHRVEPAALGGEA